MRYQMSWDGPEREPTDEELPEVSDWLWQRCLKAFDLPPDTPRPAKRPWKPSARRV